MASRVPTVAQEGVLGGARAVTVKPRAGCRQTTLGPRAAPRGGPQAPLNTLHVCGGQEPHLSQGDAGTGGDTPSSPLLRTCTLVLAHSHTPALGFARSRPCSTRCLWLCSHTHSIVDSWVSGVSGASGLLNSAPRTASRPRRAFTVRQDTDLNGDRGPTRTWRLGLLAL